MGNYLLISSDSHAGLPTPQYRPYLEKKFHNGFDQQLAAPGRLDNFEDAPEKGILLQAHLHRWTKDDPVCAEIRKRARGSWEIEARLKEMDREGIASEVIFPDGQFDNNFPFGGFFGHGPADLRVAGAKAHNRWLAEFCARAPERLFGLAMIMPFDIDDTVAEIHRCRAEGLRGILLSTHEYGLRHFHDRYYDPMWAVCADLGMPVHLHAGEQPDIYGGFNLETIPIVEHEAQFFRQRTLAHMVLSGVFVRHAKLRFILTEMGMDWIPAALDRMELAYNEVSMTTGVTAKSRLGLAPWRCWLRNCAVGATFVSSDEMKMWNRLGSDTIMWGTDYPHVEATWPNSIIELRKSFAGIPDEETRKMVGLNAARIYGFNMKALAPIVDRIGPPEGSLVSGPVAKSESPYSEYDYAENRVFANTSFATSIQRSMNLRAEDIGV